MLVHFILFLAACLSSATCCLLPYCIFTIWQNAALRWKQIGLGKTFYKWRDVFVGFTRNLKFYISFLEISDFDFVITEDKS